MRGAMRGDGTASPGESDKALWLTLAQSWVQLAEHVERAKTAQSPAVECSEAS